MDINHISDVVNFLIYFYNIFVITSTISYYLKMLFYLTRYCRSQHSQNNWTVCYLTVQVDLKCLWDNWDIEGLIPIVPLLMDSISQLSHKHLYACLLFLLYESPTIF